MAAEETSQQAVRFAWSFSPSKSFINELCIWERLTVIDSTGWNPASDIPAVLLQVRLAIAAWERPARLQLRGDYGVGEAVEAYKRACLAHGWEVPKDFDTMAYSEENLPLGSLMI